jgi:outer membrane receptor for ferrienterochelin and colicin
VQSPRASVLVHPSDRSTIRGIVGTAFRTPTFLESYIDLAIGLPLQGASTRSQGSPFDQPGYKLQPEQNFSAELGYLNSESDYFTVDTAFFYNHVDNLIDVVPNRPLTVADLQNPAVQTFNPSSATYNVFIGGFENECQQFNVYGSELGARVFPVEGLDLYANTTLMSVNQDNSHCSQEQLNLLATDARTSAVKVNAGVQLRTKIGIDGSVDFHYVSPQDWAEQVVALARQQIVYQSFHLNDYELVNMSLGYRFLRNQAEVRGVVFNLLDDEHREHPFGQVIGRSVMGFLSYKF